MADPHSPGRQTQRLQDTGLTLSLLLHVILLLLVVGEVVFLASRYRVRADLTADGLYSFSASTRSVLERLEEPLRIEAYFSDVSRLNTGMQKARASIEAFLDELVEESGGAIKVQYFDPHADQETRDKAQRIGLRPAGVTDRQATAVALSEFWQGLRILYGGRRQKIIPLLDPSYATAPLLEARIIPVIKQVATQGKIKVGSMEWPYVPVTLPGRPPIPPIGWHRVRNLENVRGRFIFIDLKNTEGAHVPADIELVVLFRPHQLSDRDKYVLDQFLVRGGTVLVFADSTEYQYHPLRSFRPQSLAFDAVGSKTRFLQQLEHYGVELGDSVVSDFNVRALAKAYGYSLQGRLQTVRFPYFFHPVHEDWARFAREFATEPSTGTVDEQVAERLKELLRPGIATNHPLTGTLVRAKVGPNFYFACAVELKDPMPEGLAGTVLLRTSPLGLSETPGQLLNWLGISIEHIQANYDKMLGEYLTRMGRTQRKQYPLMVEVTGRFRSYFDGREIPRRPFDEARDMDPKPPETAREQDPDAIGPEPEQPGGGKGEDKDADAPFVARGTRPGTLIVIGDSELIRDDLFDHRYIQDRHMAKGPFDLGRGVQYFIDLLDILSEDDDLVALRNRNLTDRSLVFAEHRGDGSETPLDFEERRRGVESTVRLLNVLFPAGTFVLLWAAMALLRHRRKLQFLRTTHP